MKMTVPASWKQIAWNGIRFLAPVDWEVGKIGTRYLMLEKKSGPILEIKWGRVKGTFSHQTLLRRLDGLYGKQLGRAVRACPFPSGWEKALATYKAISFSWRGKTISGMGVILYCPICQNATLIQFYQKDSCKRKNVPQCLLASFRDHSQDDKVVWSIFDIRARIPEKFQLVKYRFEAGEFELAFASGRQKISLYRWGPASTLLGDGDLLQFVRTRVHLPQGELHPMTKAGCNAVQWYVSPPLSWWARLRGFMKLKPSLQWFRLWHLEEENRILGVKAEGKRPFDFSFLDRICADYESL